MAELTPQERLQPSLLDRLTDDEPEKKSESREKRVLSLKRLRECVMRDLAWLLNTGSLDTTEDLADYPLVADSVLNYGVRDLTGLTVSRSDPNVLERMLKEVIQNYEPRILRNTLKVRVATDEGQMNRNAMSFEIEGELWAQPVPMRLFLRTELDLETGDVRVSDEYRTRDEVMDPRLLNYYNRELQHIREMGGEFAREYPKIAGRLGLEGFECADPYVERLLEGFGFLAARVQMKIDAEFPHFTQHLMEMVYPHYLAPTPSMAVVKFEPDLSEGSLAAGVPLPRGTVLKSLLGKGDRTPCEYRTAHDLKLFPLEVVEAAYYPARDVAALGLPDLGDAKGALRIRLRTTGGQPFSEIALDRLPIFLRGPDELPMRILEQVLGNGLAVVVKSASGGKKHLEVLDRSHLGPLGFADDQALLPADDRSFQGYRLLQEYFAFPDRFRFFEFAGLEGTVRKFRSDTLDFVVALDRTQPELEDAVDASNFQLFCSPAINLFPRRADRIHLSEHENEYHVVPDRTRPMDFEVYDVVELEGHGATAEERQDFLRFYEMHDQSASREHQAYYMIRRLPRVLSSTQRRSGPRSHYVGNEVFVSLVDAGQAPFHPDLRQLSVRALCTNRDLPLQMPVGKGTTDFSLEEGAPVEAARCVAGPTMPKPSHAEGETAWRLINHLSLNYLSLIDSDRQSGAAALRELLQIYGDTAEPSIRKQVEGVRSVVSRPVNRRLRAPGPITFGRGLEVTLTLDEAAFEGTGVFLLGAVLEQFFSRYVSINSFTETVVNTVDRGEVIRWPMRTGRRHTL